MSTALARRFKLDVSLSDANYIPFKGMNDFNPKISPNLQAADDYDTDGWTGHEKTQQSAVLTIKALRKQSAGIFDPGQELVRGAQLGWGDAARVYARWYDRNGAPEAFKGRFIVQWEPSKTGVADLDEVSVVLTSDGAVSTLTNPSTAPLAPVVTGITPSGRTTDQIIVIAGAYLTGATAVTVGGTAAEDFEVLSDSTIVATVPAGSAGSAAVVVTTPLGSTSTGYTRG